MGALQIRQACEATNARCALLRLRTGLSIGVTTHLLWTKFRFPARCLTRLVFAFERQWIFDAALRQVRGFYCFRILFCKCVLEGQRSVGPNG